MTEHIRVAYASGNPNVAEAGVNAVVRAYVANHDAKVLKFEEERRAKIQNEAHDIDARVAASRRR